MRDGVIQRFEFTAELAWKTAREYLLTLEITDINNPKNVMSEAYHNQLITDESGGCKSCGTEIPHPIYTMKKKQQKSFTALQPAAYKLFDELLNKLQAI